MPARRVWICLALAALLAACAKEDDSFRDINARKIMLPDGTPIRAEVKADRQSQAVGMMYRDSLPNGRGMLFLYRAPVREAYWMHNCKIPLDIIWIGKDGTVVEVVPDAPPCYKPESACPSYGGHEMAQYVLELGAGQAKQHGVAKGSVIRL